ncbi:beta-galactosidase 15 isoform X2 [Ananas comosus]|uniref:beta-galactosidase n=1 Tax=Ananas comosus TaxID=4615 RepID=A0A6P5GN70_ANACO|nr:beta-galactosidase 15 isoform X2 [Ananas comosus]
MGGDGRGILGFRRSAAVVAAAVAVHLIAAAASAAAFFEPFNVSYDHRALLVGGERRMLIAAGIHYPRATPDMWPGLIAKSKEGGADVIQTYVFWNGHEPIRGQYNFEGRYDLVKFVKLVAEQGLYLHLRIGPYVCAEWNFGGLPVWLRDIPGIEFRTDNAPFKDEMQRFVKKVVDMMKQEMLFSWQGGPIILVQYGQGGKAYVKWAAEMAIGLSAGVPWVMCKQTDAPENIIDACNGFYCDGFKPNNYRKPVLWTEDWNGWYASWGGRLPHRPVRDNAFAVARFFQRGGCFQNYYMFFGGTNFGRTSGGPNQITSYEYDAPIDEYGLLSQPKWGHLKDLHAAIKLCEPALTVVDSGPQYVKLGSMQEAHIYANEQVDPNRSVSGNVSICSAFLANIDEHKSVSVRIFGKNFDLPPWSVSILPDCQNVAFNTAKVGTQLSIKTVESGSPSYSTASAPGFLLLDGKDLHISKTWSILKEPIGAWGNNSFTTQGILEHLNVTKDVSDYLWYITRVNISDEDVAFWDEKGASPFITINKTRDVVRIFVNGHLSGSKVGHWVSVEQPVQLVEGYNELAILTETVGLQNYGAFLEKDGAGIRGQIKLTGLKDGELDLSNFLWTYQVGLMGEYSKLYDPKEQENVGWTDLQVDNISSGFTWYKTLFDAPEGNDPVALDLGSMGKGQAWVNGHGIGRYWSLIAPQSGCSESCDYRGAYNENKCTTNCGLPTQSWYHIPREWLQDFDNLLVLFEETGGDPLKISLKTHSTKTICAEVAENHYPPLSAWSHPDVINGIISINKVAPEVHLRCDEGHVISSITFASYGTPNGSCQKFSRGNCHAPSSLSVVTKACQGRNNCRIGVSNDIFGDPCRGTLKTLAVEAECLSPDFATEKLRDAL